MYLILKSTCIALIFLITGCDQQTHWQYATVIESGQCSVGNGGFVQHTPECVSLIKTDNGVRRYATTSKPTMKGQRIAQKCDNAALTDCYRFWFRVEQ